MASKKKKPAPKKGARASRPILKLSPELAYEVQRLLWRQTGHEERRSLAAERSASALEVIAQYVADYATRDRVQRMLPGAPGGGTDR